MRNAWVARMSLNVRNINARITRNARFARFRRFGRYARNERNVRNVRNACSARKTRNARFARARARAMAKFVTVRNLLRVLSNAVTVVL